jgi:hypothetical protein
VWDVNGEAFNHVVASQIDLNESVINAHIKVDASARISVDGGCGVEFGHQT